jgi:hypothetical protein
LKKGYDMALEDSGIFLSKDATTVLGVGKNMVRAIRYWSLAYKTLIEVRREDNARLYDVHPTRFGSSLLDDAGWDPYLEDPGSLWLLHWQLLRHPSRAPAWWAIFNSTRIPEFSDAALLAELRRYRDEEGWEQIADSSLDKDVRCLLRMYGSATQGRDLVEDSVDSPFSDLEMLRPVPGAKRQWSLNLGVKSQLPDAIVAYACLDYAQSTDGNAKVIGVAGLTRSQGAPGRAFALTESVIGDALTRYAEAHPDVIGLTHAAGSRQLVLPSNLEIAGSQVLRDYYARSARGGKKR